MTSLITFISRIRWTLLIACLVSGNCWGAESASVAAAESIPSLAPESIDLSTLSADAGRPAVRAESHSTATFHSGYRFLSVNDSGGRAAEYDYLHSNPDLGGLYNYLGPDTKFSVEGRYLNDKDFHGDLVYDYKGIYRFSLRTESLYHNLDHEKLFSPDFVLGASQYLANDLDSGGPYGIRTEQDEARFRYKLARLPVHLNLGYWRMTREGTSQLRFSDHAFEGTPNTVYAESRRMDRQTHEGTVSLDAHLGLFDLTYSFLIREFREGTATPADISYIDRPAPILRPGGIFQHNENPGSRFYVHKAGIHTTMSGGLVGAVSFAHGTRENLSTLTDVTGARQAEDTIRTVAGDISYTPSTFFSLAVKYRRFEIDRESPGTIVHLPSVPSNVPVRPAIDSRKDTVTVSALYRPATLMTLKGEYKGEFLTRDNLGFWVEPGRIATLSYPANSATHTGSLTLLARPFKGARAKLQYLYAVADQPAFAHLPGEKHEGSLLVGYTGSRHWGVTASTRISRASSDEGTLSTIVTNPSVPVTPFNTTTFRMPKEWKTDHSSVSVWFAPLKNLTLSGSYGFMRSSSDQAILFSGPQAGSITTADYTQQAQVFAAHSTYHVDELLDLSLGLQQVRSTADFDPNAISFGASSNTVGVRDISQLATVESSLTARADYRLTRGLSCTLEYVFKDYDDKFQPQFNGSVNSVTLYLAATW